MYFTYLKEDDRLYIPLNYFHFVYNLKLSLSIACWRDHYAPGNATFQQVKDFNRISDSKKFRNLLRSKSNKTIEIVPRASLKVEEKGTGFTLPKVPHELWEYITSFFSDLDLVHFSAVKYFLISLVL